MKIICENIPENVSQDTVDKLLSQVSEQRRCQALKYKHLKSQYCCLRSYFLLLFLLKEYDATEVLPEFVFNENGKPSLRDFPDIYFSISHCDTAIAVAVDVQPIGIDVESRRHISQELLDHTMNEDEKRLISRSDDVDMAFLEFWTKKEAVVKLEGGVVTQDLRNILSRRDFVVATTIDKTRGLILSTARF